MELKDILIIICLVALGLIIINMVVPLPQEETQVAFGGIVIGEDQLDDLLETISPGETATLTSISQNKSITLTRREK